jgi:hypothetical protein
MGQTAGFAAGAWIVRQPPSNALVAIKGLLSLAAAIQSSGFKAIKRQRSKVPTISSRLKT